jgi:CheY-like chemotaxis protein
MTRDELLATRILVVDDEDANVRLLEELLQREGFQQVIATTDSSRVMGLVNAFEPDLILLDLMMPAPDGYALLEQLSRYTGPERFLPVIVLTADPSRSTRHTSHWILSR